MKKFIKFTSVDNVATVFYGVPANETLMIDGAAIQASETIPYGHKIAVTHIPQGAHIIKYGEIMGSSTKDIRPGDWVHVHNIQSIRGLGKR